MGMQQIYGITNSEKQENDDKTVIVKRRAEINKASKLAAKIDSFGVAGVEETAISGDVK